MARQLVEINRRFYRESAASFSRTRRRLQPGILRAFATVAPRGTLLDLGCGNARVAAHLEELEGEVGHYLGLDFSRPLMEGEWSPGRGVTLLEADLSRPGWSRAVAECGHPPDHAICLACLHHLPGREGRQGVLAELAGLLPAGGSLVLSVWQVLHHPRLVRKVRPWSLVGLADDRVDPGDLLMTWGAGEEALRYVHQCDPSELERSCRQVGLEVVETYRSDGETGDLSLYLVCRKKASPKVQVGPGRGGSRAIPPEHR